MKTNRLAAFGLAAGLLGGGAAGLALGVPGLASAQSDETTTSEAPAAKPERGQWREDALAPLVANGTITQAQADAVIAALEAGRPAKGPHGHHGHGPHRHGLSAAATALGMTEAELRTALEGGQTLAQVAQSKGVSVDTVVNAIVAEIKTKLNEQVAAGRLTQAQADERLAEATERTKAFVNGEGKPFGGGHRGPA
jgi:hypothetical protein